MQPYSMADIVQMNLSKLHKTISINGGHLNVWAKGKIALPEWIPQKHGDINSHCSKIKRGETEWKTYGKIGAVKWDKESVRLHVAIESLLSASVVGRLTMHNTNHNWNQYIQMNLRLGPSLGPHHHFPLVN